MDASRRSRRWRRAQRRPPPSSPTTNWCRRCCPTRQAAAASDAGQEYRSVKRTAKALEIAVDWCEKVNAILKDKSSFLEADGYKRFVLTAGLNVAMASADAEYLGIGGERATASARRCSSWSRCWKWITTTNRRSGFHPTCWPLCRFANTSGSHPAYG